MIRSVNFGPGWGDFELGQARYLSGWREGAVMYSMSAYVTEIKDHVSPARPQGVWIIEYSDGSCFIVPSSQPAIVQYDPGKDEVEFQP